MLVFQKMYTHVTKRFSYEGLDQPIYLDETNLRMVLTLQRSLALLAEQLYLEGDTTQAREVIELCTEAIITK